MVERTLSQHAPMAPMVGSPAAAPVPSTGEDEGASGLQALERLKRGTYQQVLLSNDSRGKLDTVQNCATAMKHNPEIVNANLRVIMYNRVMLRVGHGQDHMHVPGQGPFQAGTKTPCQPLSALARLIGPAGPNHAQLSSSGTAGNDLTS
eukprot:363138-Chlamydomonas_euryale.AAC.3